MLSFAFSLPVVASCVFFSMLLVGSRADDHGAASLSYDADTFTTGVEAKRNFVMFFAPWCGHCKNLAPTWNELAKIYNKEEDSPVTVAKVDCTEHTALCAEHEITGFPTLKLFEKGGKSFKRYSGRRDLESLHNFVQEQILGAKENAEAPAAAAEEGKKESLLVLNDDNFEASVASGSFFIKFYAPWCGHCKKLAPTWDELAAAFADNDKISIAKIDCTQSSVICKKYEVRGYPTLLWFQDGEKITKYQSGRSLEALSDYVATQLELADINKEVADDDDAGEEGDKMEVEGEVKDLNDDNFKSFLSTRLVFVKFFAPWCGHCKRLAPAWEELAKNLAGEQVSIAKVDCTQHKSVCTDYQVRGYPTLKIFRNGEHVEDYRGSRTVEDLQQFVKTHLAQKDEL